MNLDTIRQFIESWGYIIVFLGVGIESFGVPFPGETVLLVAAAIAASSSRLHIEWVILWAALGAIIGDSCGYWAGREIGRPLLNRVGPILHFDAKKQAKLERYFQKHGSKTVFIGRFISILRTWAAFFAGMNHMHYPAFLTWNALGGVVWASAVGIIGFLFGQNLPLLEKWLGDFSYALLALVVIAGVGYWLWKRAKDKTERRQSTD
ncbi:MAG TPA: DedA family protein [Chloroflexia bacterium]|nr:DedA family protein [Chloroflexia bacterium]